MWGPAPALIWTKCGGPVVAKENGVNKATVKENGENKKFILSAFIDKMSGVLQGQDQK